jgi:acyl-CoA dehydrogenase
MPENLPQKVSEAVTDAQEFIKEVLLPLKADSKGAAQFVREASKDKGLYFKTQPAEFGGQPASTLELTALRECFSAANHPLTRHIFGPGPGVLHAVEGELRSGYLAPVLRGEKRGAFAFTEPDTATRPSWGVVQDDRIVINGQKSYVTGGSTADFISALINIEHADGRKAGTAMVVIDRNATGVSINREFTSLDGSAHVSMVFDQVEVPVTHVIGNIGEGMPRALANIGNVRMMVSAQASGMCIWVTDYIEQHLKAPHRSGSPLGDREGVRMRFADMRIEAYVARSALYRTARLVDSGENCVNETAATKVFTTETAGRVVDMGVQLYGGQALVTGHPLEQLYRQVRSLRFVEGANDLLRLNIAKGKLDLNKERL